MQGNDLTFVSLGVALELSISEEEEERGNLGFSILIEVSSVEASREQWLHERVAVSREQWLHDRVAGEPSARDQLLGEERGSTVLKHRRGT